MSRATLELLTGPTFLWSLLAGALALAWALAEQRLAERRPGRPWVDPGGTLALAFFLAMALLGGPRVPGAWLGALLLGLGLELGRRGGLPPLATPLAALPGAVVLSIAGGLPRGPAFEWLALATAPLAASLATGVERLGPRRAPGCVLLAIVGAFFTVPETQEAVVLLGAALPWGALVLLRDPPAIGPLGAGALAGALAWTAAVGGRSRPGSAVAALACLGLLLLAWPVAALARQRGRAWPGPGRAGLLLAQLGVVFVAGRLLPQRGALETLLCEAAWLLLVGGLILAAALRAPLPAEEASTPT